jgi:hypothetical protein
LFESLPEMHNASPAGPQTVLPSKNGAAAFQSLRDRPQL